MGYKGVPSTLIKVLTRLCVMNGLFVCPRPHFLCLIMHMTISAPDKWVISSRSEPPPSDACLRAIVAVVMNRWPMRFDRGGEVINQLHQKQSALRCAYWEDFLSWKFKAENVINEQKCRGEENQMLCWRLTFQQHGFRDGNYQNPSWHLNCLFQPASCPKPNEVQCHAKNTKKFKVLWGGIYCHSLCESFGVSPDLA